MNPVIIAGAGWAGLAAGVELARRGQAVIVYESAKQIGGRARDVEIDDITVDNGQHLMIGAYHQLLQLLEVTGVDETDVLHRLPQHLRVLDLHTRRTVFELSLPRWPAPLHLLAGILRCRSLSFTQKFQTLRRFNALLNKPLSQDMPVTAWLDQARLPATVINYLLKPLCLAALTTPPGAASARTLQTVLQQTFNGARDQTDLLMAKTTLGRIFPLAAARYIEAQGGSVLTGHKVERLHPAERRITVNGVTRDYAQLILATPGHITQQLLQPHPGFAAQCAQLEQLQYEPVSTVYVQYAPDTRLPLPMLGCVNATSEWIFDRVHCRQPGLMAVVISGQGPHMLLSGEALATQVSQELAALFPDWPQAQSAHVIREKRACFRSHVDVDRIRPGIGTADPNIRLCGDYVYIEEKSRPGLPATLEAALRCGVKCAQQISRD